MKKNSSDKLTRHAIRNCQRWMETFVNTVPDVISSNVHNAEKITKEFYKLNREYIKDNCGKCNIDCNRRKEFLSANQ